MKLGLIEQTILDFGMSGCLSRRRCSAKSPFCCGGAHSNGWQEDDATISTSNANGVSLFQRV
jgi:hypothetical protein